MKNKRSTIILSLVAFSIFLPHLATAAVTHHAKKNETLATIAKKYDVSVKELKAANNLVTGKVKPGDVLVIPVQSASADTARGKGTYTVQEGDHLSSIAHKHGISVALLRRLNGIKREGSIKPGQVLVLRKSHVETARREEEPKYLRNAELFSEQEYEQTLAELTDADLDQKVDLSKNVELKVETIRDLKKSAYSFLGIRYRFGGESRKGIDCSSFVQQVFRDLNVDLPRTAREQYVVGEDVPPNNLQKGDLVFFRTYARFPSHVGIYLGDNKMIHASSANHKVVISTMDTPYYRSRYIGAKRIAQVNPAFTRLDDLVQGVEVESDMDVLKNDSLGLLPAKETVAGK